MANESVATRVTEVAASPTTAMIESGVVARLILLAADKGKAEAIGMAFRQRRRPRAANRTRDAAGIEAIPIPARGLQPMHFGVNAVCCVGRGERHTLSDDIAHTFIGRHTPLNAHRFGRHSARWLQRLWREPRPKHDAIGPRISGGDP